MITPAPPRAARGSYPFKQHRTVAELDAFLGFRMGSRLERRVTPTIDEIVGLSEDQGATGLQQRSTMPETSCPRCGARGWCGHAGRLAA